MAMPSNGQVDKERVFGPLPVGNEAMSSITRRNVIALFGGSTVVAWSSAAVAEAPSRLWKIGVLANESWPPLEGLRDGLRELGYVEGKSHLFVYRFAQGNAERFPAL